jgi:C-terminal processing protease CtpA/Prc
MRPFVVMCVSLVIGCGPGTPPARPPAPVPPAPAVAAAVQPVPEREDFESVPVGSAPAGWARAGMAKDLTFAAARGDTGNALQIETTGTGGGSIKRPLEVARYRGKRLLLTARGTAVAGQRPRGTVGIDVARPGVRGYGDRARTARIELPTWQGYRTVVDVASDATRLDLVITSSGDSRILIDDITVSVLGGAGTGDEPPRALAGRALDNVVAFARLYGIVRYFHPSDEAAALDNEAWHRFLVRGVREVESATDAAMLETRLETLFAPIAPAVVISRDAAATPAAAGTGPTQRWLHRGIGISKNSVYTSVRGGDQAMGFTTITTPIDPALVRGKELKVTLRARARLAGARADVGLWIFERRADRGGFYSEPEMQPAVGAAWTEIQVQGQISADARSLKLGVQLIGNAEAWLEPPVVTADGKPLTMPGWGVPGPKLAAAWSEEHDHASVAIGGDGCARPRPCLHLRPKSEVPLDRRPWSGALGGGVAASVPLVLPAPAAPAVTAAPAPAAPPASDATPLVASDRATRLAAVIVAWNVFQHFYPYFDVVGTDWMTELPRRLGEAAVDDGPAAFHATLRRLVYQLHDGHGAVLHAGEDLSRVAPWLWERVEGKLAITQVSELCACDLAPGDVVTAIDGVPTEQAFATAGALMSSATEQFRSFLVLQRLRAGPEGGRRTLRVERNGAAHDVTVALIEPGAAPIERRPASGDEVAPGIRYVDIDRVTGDQWNKILPDLAAAKAIICDVRGYPNQLSLVTPLEHFAHTKLRSAQWHVPSPARPDREGVTFSQSSWTVSPIEPFLGNVVFLTDGRAVSAAETYLGIVEAHKLGPIVGSATAGTNGNINPFALPGDYTMSWTGMKVLKHDGSRHHGVGILPTVPASKTLAGVAAQRDEVLEKGIETAQRLRKVSTDKARRRAPRAPGRTPGRP